MNILVTGSNGFIGGHVSRYLREQGNYVVGLGRREYPVCEVDEYICCDIDSVEAESLCGRIKAGRLDAVVHLAADMRKEPYGVEVVSHNCVGTQRLLELCEKNGVGVFAQLSSLPVIGKPIEHPITEKHSLAPPSVYHATKVMEELLANYADDKHGLRTVSFRISAPVGIGMNPNTIFPTFVKRALKGENLILSGKGARKQTYVHVADISQAISLALQKENAHGVYNLSSYNCLSNRALAEKCIEILHSDSKIVFSGKEDEMDDYVWDVSLERIHGELGYEPQIIIEQAILEYADSIRFHCGK